MFKTQWNQELQASCFTAKISTFYGGILWSIRVYTTENCRRFVFYNNMEKVRAELALFSVENARVLHLTSLLLSVKEIKNAPSALLSYISTREFLRTRKKCREARAVGECLSALLECS